MKTSQEGIELIKRFEGCKLKAYLDPIGIPTIGWGNTYYPDGSKVKLGQFVTQQQADELLLTTIVKFERKVLARIVRPMKQNEFDAAVSFCYNAGTGYRSNGVYHDFSLWGHINNRFTGIKPYWENLATTASGVKLNGLITRRKAEVSLYLK